MMSSTVHRLADPPHVRSPRRSEWTPDLVLLLALAFLSWAAVGRNLGSDPDLWGHLRYGLDHLDHGHLSRTDPYSYTAPQAEWINHEWLCELVFALAWRTAGVLGLWALSMGLVAVTLGIMLSLMITATRGFWAVTGIYVACWFSMSIGFSMRPQLFTFALTAVALWWVDRLFVARTWPLVRALALVPLCALWANLHGGFLVGVALLLFVAAHELVRWLAGHCSARRAGATAGVVGLAVLATLLNPYGWHLWRWLFQALSVSRADAITEWGSAFGHGSQRDLLGYYAMVVLLAVVLLRSPLRRSSLELGLLVATAAAAWIQVRHVVIFCMIAAIYLPRHLEAMVPLLARPRSFHPRFRRVAAAFMVVAAIVLNARPSQRPDRLAVPLSEQPYLAFQFIHQQGLQGNLAVEFNWAQAAIWYLHDSCKVAYDGRFRTVYPPPVERAFVDFARATGDWSRLLDDYPTDLVLMPDHWSGWPLLEQRGDWVCLYRSDRSSGGGSSDGEGAVLFARRGRYVDLERRVAEGSGARPPRRTTFWFGEPL